jgi:hypothetical protein
MDSMDSMDSTDSIIPMDPMKSMDLRIYGSMDLVTNGSIVGRIYGYGFYGSMDSMDIMDSMDSMGSVNLGIYGSKIGSIYRWTDPWIYGYANGWTYGSLVPCWTKGSMDQRIIGSMDHTIERSMYR